MSLFLFWEVRSDYIPPGSPSKLVPPPSALIWPLPCQHQQYLYSLHGSYWLTHSTDWINLLSEWINRSCWFYFWAISQTCPFLPVPTVIAPGKPLIIVPVDHPNSLQRASLPSSLYPDSTSATWVNFLKEIWSCLLISWFPNAFGIKSKVLSMTFKALHNQVSNNPSVSITFR